MGVHVGQSENDWGRGDLTHMAPRVICPGVKKHYERNPDMVERIKKGFPDGQRSNFLRNVDSCRIDI